MPEKEITFATSEVGAETLKNALDENIENLEEVVGENDEAINFDDLTDEQKRVFLIEQLKQSKIKFRPIVHKGKVTINQFDAAYKKKRQNRNKMQKQSRKINRKK